MVWTLNQFIYNTDLSYLAKYFKDHCCWSIYHSVMFPVAIVHIASFTSTSSFQKVLYYLALTLGVCLVMIYLLDDLPLYSAILGSSVKLFTHYQMGMMIWTHWHDSLAPPCHCILLFFFFIFFLSFYFFSFNLADRQVGLLMNSQHSKYIYTGSAK